MNIKHIGRYEVIGELGAGGMATVLLGKDSFMDREVAIKLLPKLFMHDPTFKERFQREAKLLAQLEHSAIVRVYDFGYHEEQPYMVNRYMRGGTLLEKISKQGALPIEKSLGIISRVCSALDAAHKRGTVHRDVKPANILFDDTGQAFIADFGFAKLAQSTSTLTGNTLVGTPAYMSPEQFSGEFKVDGRSDQYSLAIVLFEMLSWELPFKGDTTAKLMKNHLMDDPPSLRTIRSDLPESIEPVVEKALQKKPDDRFPDIEAFHQALADAVRGEPWVSEAPRVVPPAPKPAKVYQTNVFSEGEDKARELPPEPAREDVYATNIFPVDIPLSSKPDEASKLDVRSKSQQKKAKKKGKACVIIGSFTLLGIIGIGVIILGVIWLQNYFSWNNDSPPIVVPPTVVVNIPEGEEDIEQPEEQIEPEEEIIQTIEDPVVAQEYFYVDDPRAHVGFMVKNQNTSITLADLEYTIYIYDADGNIVGERYNTIPWLLPEQELGIWHSFSQYDKNLPTTYSIMLEHDGAIDPGLSENPFATSKIKLTVDYDWPVATGVVKNNSTNIYTDLRITVLCYDANGNIVGGGRDHLGFIPGRGETGFMSYLYKYGDIESIEVFPFFSDESETHQDTAELWGRISIVDQDFFLDNSENLYGGVIIQNELYDDILADVILNVTFYDPEGFVISKTQQYIDYLLPGQTIGIADYIDTPSHEGILSGYEAWVFPGEILKDDEIKEIGFSVSSARLIGDDLNKVKVSFTNEYNTQVSEVYISVLMYDDNDRIIGGGWNYSSDPVPSGETGEGEIYVYYDYGSNFERIDAWVILSSWAEFE